MTTDHDLRPRRFSEGMEHMPSLPASARLGSFADGTAKAVPARVGTFADGLALRPAAPPARPIGRFADRFVPPVETVPARPRVGVPPVRPRPQEA
jgi:hypothetical protein